MANPLDACYNITSFRGSQPSADFLPKEYRRYVEAKFIPGYTNMLDNCFLASDVVEHARTMVQERGVLSGRVANKPFFVSDIDMGINGAVGNASALVIPGKRDSPLRIAMAHTDVPGLRVVGPWCVADAETSTFSSNFYFATKTVGGIRAEDWYGRKVFVRGYIYENGKRRLVDIPGLIEQWSVHTDEGDSRRTKRDIRVTTPYRTLKEMYKGLGIKDAMDFGKSDLYVFPVDHKAHRVDNRLAAFAQDDRACYYAAQVAGLESLTTDNTVLIFGLDMEEIGSTGNSGSYRGFFEEVLKQTLKQKYGRAYRKMDLPNDLNKVLLGGMPAVSLDVDVAFSAAELESNEPERINFRTSAVSGYGFFISGNNVSSGVRTSPKHVETLIDLFSSQFPGKRKRDRFQVTWSPHSEDSKECDATMADAFDGLMPMVCMGVPLISTHHPGTENLNVYDLASLKFGTGLYFMK